MNISVVLISKLAKVANPTVFFRHTNLLKYGSQLILFTPFLSLDFLNFMFPILPYMLLLIHLRIEDTCYHQLRIRICAELLILRQLLDDRPLYIFVV